jgi:hypothetical protein
MEYPHWLMIAGAVLLVLGFIGLVLRQRKDAEAEIKETASGDEQGPSEFDAELARTQAANRKAKLADEKRQRWTNKGRDTKEEPLNDTRKPIP